MPSLVETVGGASANSYVTVAEADTYFDERHEATAWTDTSDPDVKVRALITATRRIDLEHFEGRKTAETQALEWPRCGATDDNFEVSSDIIPVRVKHATFEMALALLDALTGDEDLLEDSGLRFFRRVKLGPIEVEPRDGVMAAPLPDIVRRLLRPFLLSTVGSLRLVRG